MKKMKKLLAVTLSVAMVCGVFVVIPPKTVEAATPTTKYFKETFSTDGAFDEAWVSNSSNLATWKGCVKDGKLTIKSDNSTAVYLKADDEALQDTVDYTVSVKVQFDKMPTVETTNIGLVARATSVSSNGYEFQLTVKADGTAPYVRLRDRSGSYYTNLKRLEDLDITQENEFKIECKGNDIVCYINNEVCIRYTASEDGRYAGYDAEKDAGTDKDVYTNVYSTGTAALRFASTKVGANVTFDDFIVSRIAKFSDNFNQYDSDATKTQKYNALTTNGWYVKNSTQASLLTDGAYILPSTNDIAPLVLQTENAKGALGWNDYVVEADVTIGAEGEELSKNIQVSVTGRHSEAGGTDGYEIEFYYKADGKSSVLRIRKRVDNAPYLVEGCSCAFDINPGQTYNLKAIFQGNTIYAYVDDVLYLKGQDDTYSVGFAGIGNRTKETGVDIKFDNFAVYDYDVVPAIFEDDFSEYVPQLNADNLYEMTQLTDKGWKSTSNKLLRYSAQHASDGVLKLPATRPTETESESSKQLSYWTMSLSTKDAPTWKNCKIECDLSYALSSSVSSPVRTYVYIAGRGTTNESGNITATTSGYGLYVGTNASTGNSAKIRYIGIVKNGKAVGTENIDLTYGNRLPFNETLTAVLELNERMVKGYILGYEDTTTVEYTIPEEETITAGHVGIYTYMNSNEDSRTWTEYTNHDVTIDNFKVYDFDNPYVKELVGDVKADGVINKTDIDAMINRLKKNTLGAAAIDVNKDGEKNIYDYVRLMRLYESLK